jgi:dihydrofolate reductase
MEKCIIVAIADNRAIGKANALLWHIAEDMKYFRVTTTGSPVVMGWMTFQSIGGKPLPKRDNVVISIFPWPDRPEGIKVAGSLEEAYSMVDPSARKVFVMGGGETYRQALPTADKLYITHVHATIEDADTFFPEIKETEWKLLSAEKHEADENNPYAFTFAEYVKEVES